MKELRGFTRSRYERTTTHPADPKAHFLEGWDRSKASLPSVSRGIPGVNLLRARWEEGVGFTMEVDGVHQLHEGLATRFCKPHSGEESEALVPTTDRHLGESGRNERKVGAVFEQFGARIEAICFGIEGFSGNTYTVWPM